MDEPVSLPGARSVKSLHFTTWKMANSPPDGGHPGRARICTRIGDGPLADPLRGWHFPLHRVGWVIVFDQLKERPDAVRRSLPSCGSCAGPVAESPHFEIGRCGACPQREPEEGHAAISGLLGGTRCPESAFFRVTHINPPIIDHCARWVCQRHGHAGRCWGRARLATIGFPGIWPKVRAAGHTCGPARAYPTRPASPGAEFRCVGAGVVFAAKVLQTIPFLQMSCKHMVRAKFCKHFLCVVGD